MMIFPSIANNFSDVVGYATHPIYPSFAAPESRSTINGNTLLVSDYAIYKTGYYSINGGAWQNFSLSGNTLSGNWISSTATYTLPTFSSGESYIVIYTCTKNSDGTWNCHDGTTGKWQLQIINNTVPSNPTSPTINYIPPTPNNAATIQTSNTEITANIADDSNAISSWIDFDKSLVGYWSMDSYNTKGIYDNSSYKNFGIFTGGLSTSNIVAGVRGNGLSFDGVNDSLSLPLSTSVAGRTEITLSMWTYFSDISTARALYSDYIADGSWKFALNQGFNTPNKLDVEFRNTNTEDTGTRTSLVSSINTPVNQWVHIAVVYSTSLGYVKLYMNGIEVGSTTTNIVPFTSTASAGVLIGNDGDPYSPDGFSGSLDEVMLFNRALSASEIKALYDSKTNNLDTTLNNLVNGQYTYTVYAINGAGNTASASQRTLNVNATVLSCSGSNIQSCTSSIPNAASATQTRTCNSSTGIWSAYGSCNLISCNSGYTPSGNICVLNNVPTDSTDLGVCLSNGYNCGTPTISGSNKNCGSCSDGLSCTNNLCISPTSGQTLYVATNGNDNNPGTFSQPYATINKAWSIVNAGGIIYVRGGTYTYTMMGQTSLYDRSGQAGKMINIWNYPGEHPIINFSANTFTSAVRGIQLQNANYIHIKGIRVTSINQPICTSTYCPAQYGLILWDSVNNCIFEQLETDHIGGWGVVVGSNCNNILFLNDDSHHNADPYSGPYNGEPYGWSDGFQSGSWGVGRVSNNITYNGCRSWMNSDDGWDLRQAAGLYTIENCWSFSNGYNGGNGEGYKLGQSFDDATTDIRRVLVNSMAWNNLCGVEAVGGESSSAGGGVLGMHIYNNIFYNNAVGSDIQKSSNGGYIGQITFRNNVIYHSNLATAYGFNDIPIHDHNNLDIPITVTDSDFVSINSTGADGPRNADGSLPTLKFLHLASGSKLIDTGVNVGLPFNSNAPDLGAFETN